MTRTSRSIFSASAAALGLALAALVAPLANAASISYGNFGPVAPGVTFLNVTESSGTDTVPLYGPPTPFVTGLDFNPTSFVSTANGGAADITDGQLNFSVAAAGGINGITLNERGDYTIAGAGTPATSVFAGAIILATVSEINGVAVAPINLVPVNGSIGFGLPGAAIAQPWSLGLALNVASQLGPNQVATKVDVAINNTLLAISEPGTIAFIAKKDFVIGVDAVPEPTTLALGGLALCALGAASRRKLA